MCYKTTYRNLNSIIVKKMKRNKKEKLLKDLEIYAMLYLIYFN